MNATVSFTVPSTTFAAYGFHKTHVLRLLLQITSSSLQHSSNYSSYSSSSGGGTAMTTYEAVSPAAPAHSASEHFDTNIALHGLADISSNREKLPLQEKHVSHHSTAQHGQVREVRCSPVAKTTRISDPSKFVSNSCTGNVPN